MVFNWNFILIKYHVFPLFNILLHYGVKGTSLDNYDGLNKSLYKKEVTSVHTQLYSFAYLQNKGLNPSILDR